MRQHRAPLARPVRAAGRDASLETLVRSGSPWQAEGDPLPAWKPGAHIDLHLADGVRRQYSLCGDPGDPSRYRIGVLREVGGRGGSEFVHTRLRPGDDVEIDGPRNHFALEPAASYIFIAGGIGITPILPMIAQVEREGGQWTLLYGGRSARSMAFTAQLAPYADKVSVRPQDVHGLLDLDEVLSTPRPGTLVYCCGPELLLRAVEQHCAAWPSGSLRIERFAAPPDLQRDTSDNDAVELVLRQRGRTLSVAPDQSLLDALLDNDIPVLSDCREGICGTCEVGVVEGEVDHRDFVLTDREREAGTCMMVCVSRARSARLVLDL
jgi:ferredoxin-NADP reductase